MKLVGEIINELVDTNVEITSPLLKTKVLAVRINSPKLLDWVNGELNGYERNGEIPDYRKSTGTLYGSYMNGHMHVKNSVIPVVQLDKDVFDKMTKIEVTESVSSIQSFSNQNNLKFSVNSGAKYILESSIIEQGNRFFQLLDVYLQIPASLFTDILSSVRSKLLDFMLAIENQFGIETEIETIKTKPELITSIMNTTINNNGNGNLLTIGDKNQVSLTYKENAGSLKFIEEELIRNKVSQEDVDEVITILPSEKPKGNEFGINLNGWISKMLNKSLDGTWEIGIATAGGILSEIFKKYYGI